MAILVSPGSSITVTDMSAYVSSAVGTVPLVVLATAQDKTGPDGTLASGTTKANAGLLQAFTSQRDISSALGYASFKLSSSGTPLHGNELNEYGLLAAYSALGAANSVYAIRADIDLDQLTSTTVRPDSPPANGTYWLDLSNSTWGINEWNATTGAFTTKTPIVISDSLQTTGGVPNASIGTIGSYAVNVTATHNPVFYKNSNNTWVRVGSTDWQNSWATVTGSNVIVSSTAFALNSTFTINGTTINMGSARSLAGLVSAVNAATVTGVTAAAVNGQLVFYVNANSRSNGSIADGKISLADGSGTPLSIAGVAVGPHYSPQISFASYVGIPSWLSSDTVAAPSGSVYIKTSVQGNGLNLSVKKYNANSSSWTTLAVPAYDNATNAIYGLDPAGGGNGITAGSIYARYVTASNASHAGYRIFFRADATGTNVTGTVNSFNGSSFTTGQTFTLAATGLGTSVLASATCSIPANGNATQFVAAILAANIPYVTATVTSSGYITISHQLGGDIYLTNTTVGSNPLATAGFTTSITSGAYNDVTLSADLVLSNWTPSGSGTGQQPYTYSFYAPYQAPEDGTLWYYGDPATVDIMVNNNGWKNYRNVTSDARGYNLQSTDPMGVIVSATKPTTQQDGSTALATGDLWLDSSDLVNYPSLYRYNGSKFVAIDNSDQTSQNGILFADARWDLTGTTDVITGSLPDTSTMLTGTNYLDLDAPDYRLYPRGTLLFNTRRSGYNVKQYESNYFNAVSFPNDSLPTVKATWQTVSGLKDDGSMYAGAGAQRHMVIKAMKSAIAANDQIREDQFAFNLIAAPGYPELISDMVGLNNDRANTAFVIGDTPMTLETNSVSIINWANNSDGTGLSTADPYLGVYYPSAVTSDVAGNTVVVPPSHVMMRTFIRNDNVSYPWFAPAGVRRGLVDNATDIGYIDQMTGEFQRNGISQGMRDVMYENNVNPITILPGVGLVVWGQKTRNPITSAMDRVNVARLVNYLRTIFAKTGNAFLFEPNDKITRDQIKRIVESALNDLVAKRGITDYLVVCDTSNNTPNRVANNELYVDIAIEPMKDVEFIYIPIRLYNPGAIATLG
jgi:hypothetical protein